MSIEHCEYQPIPDIPVEAQLEIIEHKWYQEAALFGMARALVDRKQALEHCDALLDAYAQFKAKLPVDEQ